MPPVDPFSQGVRVTRALPFIALFVLAFAVAALPGGDTDDRALLAAASVAGAVVLVGLLAPWRRLPAGAQLVAPLGAVVVVLLLREARGGALSGYASLAIAPIVWTALYGTARQTAVVVAAVLAQFLVPLLAVHPPVEELRRAIMWSAIAPLIGAVLSTRVRGGRVAREELTRERDFISAVLDHADALVLVLDRSGTVLRFNAACEQASGRIAADVIGRPLWETVVPVEDRSAAQAELAAFTDRFAPRRREDEWVHADGSRRRLLWSIKQVPDASGRAAFVVCAGTDVTAQRAAEAALEASEVRHRRVVEAAHDVLFEVGLDGHFTYLAPQWEAMTGFTVAESVGRHVAEVFPADELAAVRAGMGALLAGTSDLVRVEHRVVRADGREIVIAVRAHALRDDDRIVAFAGAFRDVTDQVHLRRRADHDRAFVTALVAQLATGLVICDEHGRLQTFDPATGTLRPTPPDAAAEMLLTLRTVDGTPLTAEQTPLLRALRGEAVTGDELARTDMDGVARQMLVSAGPVVDQQGVTLGAVATSFDITERRAAEAQVRRQAADLEVVTGVAHALAAEQDLEQIRRRICAAARETAGAAIAILTEPNPGGTGLVTTATAGLHGYDDLVIPLGGRPSGTMIAYASGQPFAVDECLGHPAVDQAITTQAGVRSAIWQPVMRGGRTLGVLAVGWHEPGSANLHSRSSVLQLLAAEAAIAIERADIVAQLSATASTDALTGAPNRRTWDERLVHEVARARRDGLPLCVAMLDLDHFKAYNDRFGHQQGDALLKTAVATWLDEIRTTDTLARYGGEEFAAAFPACGLADAHPLVERLRDLMPFGQTCSIGLAEWDGSESPEDLLARADAALYRAKAGGRNQVALATRGHGSAADARPAADPTTHMVLRTARRLLGMDVAFLSEITEDHLVLRGLEGTPGAFGLDVGMEIPLDETFCQRLIDGRIDGIVEDTATHPATAGLAGATDAGIGAYIGAPVRLTDGRVLGTLCGIKATAAPDLDRDDLALLRGLAEVVARHIESLVDDPTDKAAIAAAWERTVGQLDARSAVGADGR